MCFHLLLTHPDRLPPPPHAAKLQKDQQRITNGRLSGSFLKAIFSWDTAGTAAATISGPEILREHRLGLIYYLNKQLLYCSHLQATQQNIRVGRYQIAHQE